MLSCTHCSSLRPTMLCHNRTRCSGHRPPMLWDNARSYSMFQTRTMRTSELGHLFGDKHQNLMKVQVPWHSKILSCTPCTYDVVYICQAFAARLCQLTQKQPDSPLIILNNIIFSSHEVSVPSSSISVRIQVFSVGSCMQSTCEVNEDGFNF